MKKIIDFIEENVNGKTLFTKELNYKLEDGALYGVYYDQISFYNEGFVGQKIQFGKTLTIWQKWILSGKIYTLWQNYY